MTLETERLILRPWREEDAEDLYRHASDPGVGPAAGWPPHTSVENSREIIRNILSSEENRAVVLKETGEVVGSVGVMKSGSGTAPVREDERELGYWIGRAYWGQGLIPEAVRELQRYCFEELGCVGLWCAYYEGNDKSRRVQEKCGFEPHHSEDNQKCRQMDEYRTEHFTYLSRERWEFNRAYADVLAEFSKGKHAVLSTSLNNRVSSRMMSIVQMDGQFYFQTDIAMKKYAQLKANPRVALCINNIQIEGICEELGHPKDLPAFSALYRDVFRGSYDRYSMLENERVFVIKPASVERWLYVDDKPMLERINIERKTAERVPYLQ